MQGFTDSATQNGLKAAPVHSAPNALRNVALFAQMITTGGSAVWPLSGAIYVPDAGRGTNASMHKVFGIYLVEQTKGATANATFFIDGGQGSIPFGNWSIYNGSTKDSVFHGPIRWASATGPTDSFGAGSPEGVVSAAVGSIYRRTDGGTGSTLYVKETGTGNTGWAAK